MIYPVIVPPATEIWTKLFPSRSIRFALSGKNCIDNLFLFPGPGPSPHQIKAKMIFSPREVIINKFSLGSPVRGLDVGGPFLIHSH